MPTVFRIGPARFFFFSNEAGEPPHIHVEQGDGVAKFWLEPISLAFGYRLNARELRRLEQLVRTNRERLLEAWNEFFKF